MSSRLESETRAATYTAAEMMTIAAARALPNGATCLVGIGLPGTAAILARVAPRSIGIAGYMYFLIGIAEWRLGEANGRMRTRISTTNTSPA